MFRLMYCTKLYVCFGWLTVLNYMYVQVDVLHKYIEKIGRSCKNYAELSGRTGPNVLDVGNIFIHITDQ